MFRGFDREVLLSFVGDFVLDLSEGLLFPSAEKVGKNAVKNQWFLNFLFAAKLLLKCSNIYTANEYGVFRCCKYDPICYLLLPQIEER